MRNTIQLTGIFFSNIPYTVQEEEKQKTNKQNNNIAYEFNKLSLTLLMKPPGGSWV